MPDKRLSRRDLLKVFAVGGAGGLVVPPVLKYGWNGINDHILAPLSVDFSVDIWNTDRLKDPNFVSEEKKHFDTVYGVSVWIPPEAQKYLEEDGSFTLIKFASYRDDSMDVTIWEDYEKIMDNLSFQERDDRIVLPRRIGSKTYRFQITNYDRSRIIFKSADFLSDWSLLEGIIGDAVTRNDNRSSPQNGQHFPTSYRIKVNDVWYNIHGLETLCSGNVEMLNDMWLKKVTYANQRTG